MSGTFPEKEGAARKEVYYSLISPGSSRFFAAAQPNLAAKRIFNPEPLILPSPQDREAMKSALRQADKQAVDVRLVETLSTGLREVITQQHMQSGVKREDLQKEWGESMSAFLISFSKNASLDQKQLFKERFAIDLDKIDRKTLWKQVGNLWDSYLANGSDIGGFFEDLMEDIPDYSDVSVLEMQRRLTLAEPLMGIFGDEHITTLLEDMCRARILLGIDYAKRGGISDAIVSSLKQQFSSDEEREAYQLVWTSIKDKLPENKPEKAREISSPPPVPIIPTQEVIPQHYVPFKNDEEAPPPPTTSPATAPQPQLQPHTSQEKKSPPSLVLSAASAIRNPEQLWLGGDTLWAKEFRPGGFSLGACDALDKGREYSVVVAQKLRSLFVKNLTFSHMPSVEAALRGAIHVFEEMQPFIDMVKQAAEKDLEALKVPDRQKKEVLDNIGTTGLVGITARDNNTPVLVTINLGHSRLVAYDPARNELVPLTADQTISGRRFRIRQILSEDEAFADEERAHLSRWVRAQNIVELEQKLQDQMINGWSRTDEVMRIFPLRKDVVYLALTNGVTLNIPPKELPLVIQRGYNSAVREDGKVDTEKLTRYIVREARRRMKNPEHYQLAIRGKSRNYIVQDAAGAAGAIISSA